MPPYTEQNLHPDVQVKLTKYNIIPKEVYDVISKFDYEPAILNDAEKILRKKYLNILLQIIKDESSTLRSNAYSMITGGPLHQTVPEQVPIIMQNYDLTISLVIRIIKLLILEIDPLVCNTMPYIIALIIITFLCLILLSMYFLA